MTENEIRRFRNFLQKRDIKESLALMRVCCGPMRFKILTLLGTKKEGFTVTELAAILNSSLSRISHQLHILKKHKFVKAKGKNRETMYALSNKKIAECLKQHKKISY